MKLLNFLIAYSCAEKLLNISERIIRLEEEHSLPIEAHKQCNGTIDLLLRTCFSILCKMANGYN